MKRRNLKFIPVVPSLMDVTSPLRTVRFKGVEWVVGFTGQPDHEDDDGIEWFPLSQMVRARVTRDVTPVE